MHNNLKKIEYPTVFKIFEISKDGRGIVNKYKQQGMRVIFIGIPDNSIGWLFYVPEVKMTYIFMDASFDERFTSPITLPDLTFKWSITLRGMKWKKPLGDSRVEITGTSVEVE